MQHGETAERNEAQLRDLLARQAAIAELGREALVSATVDELLELAATVIGRVLSADVVGITQLDYHGPTPAMVVRSEHGSATSHVGERHDLAGMLRESVSLTSERPVVLEESRVRAMPVAGLEGAVIGATVLITGAPLPWGGLGVYSRQPRTFTPEELDFMTSAAALLAAALRRHETEVALRASEERLTEAQALAQLGSYDWNIVTDTNVWSDELYRIYGTEPQSFNASYERFLSFIHPDDREKIMAIHRRAYETLEPYHMEERIIRPNGEHRILSSTGRVITDENGKPVRMAGICMDVTDQKRAEEALLRLREADDRRRQALEINDGIVQGLAVAAGAFDRGETGAARVAIHHTLESARLLMNDLLSGLENRPIAPGDLARDQAAPSVLTRGEGSASLMHEPQLPAPALGAAPPRSVRILLADDAADFRLLLRLTLRTCEGATVVGEAEDGAAAVRLAKELRPDVVLLDLAMPVMDGLQAIPEILASSPDVRIVVLSGFDEDRMRSVALGAGAHAYVEKGAPPEALIGAVNAALPAPVLGAPVPPPTDPDEETLAANGGSALEHLVHELRTPLTVVKGLLGTVQGRFDNLPSAAVEEIFQTISRNADQMNHLIEDVATASHLGDMTLHVEPVRLDDLLADVVGDFGHLTPGRPIEVRGATSRAVPADPFRLRQVLANLLSNACKFSPADTPIIVEVRPGATAVEIAVTDHGTGVPEEGREALFGRFARLHHAVPGMGLGLYLSRAIAEAHGGDLRLEHTGPEGSTFVLTVPVADVPAGSELKV